VCKLVSFWIDYSRADVSLFMVFCCLLGSDVLPWKGANVLEGDLTQGGWVRDALPLKESWLHSALVDPGNDLFQWGFRG
jgi:hypothetical protein